LLSFFTYLLHFFLEVINFPSKMNEILTFSLFDFFIFSHFSPVGLGGFLCLGAFSFSDFFEIL